MAIHRVDLTKQCNKQLSSLSAKQRQKFYARLSIFEIDMYDLRLRNHSLKGRYKGYRSIDVTGDVRAIYREELDGLILFCAIGTHSQLY